MDPYTYHVITVVGHALLLGTTVGLSVKKLMYQNIAANVLSAASLAAGSLLAFVAAPCREGLNTRHTIYAVYMTYLIPAGVVALYCAGISILGWLVVTKLEVPVWTDPLRRTRDGALGLGLIGALFAVLIGVNLWVSRRLVPPATGALE